MKRLLRPLFVVLVLALGIAIPVKAHASLVRSVPEAGEILLESPSEIVLEFNEELDPAASNVKVFDGSGLLVVPGPGVIDPDEPLVLRLTTGTLPDGVYSAVWNVRSAIDGHITNGSVGFSIGEESSPASLLPPPGTGDPATALPAAPETIARWLAYLGVAIAIGSLSFGFLIWRRAFRHEMNKSETAEEAIRRLIQRTALVSLAILGIATFSFAIIQAARAAQISPWTALVSSFSQAFIGRMGMMLGTRLILTLILGWFVLRLPSPRDGSLGSWSIILLLGGLVMLTFSLLGHAAARGSMLGVVMNWLHLAATAVWLGGLPVFFLALRRADVSATALVPRYSEAALISVGILVVTGTYQALTYVRTIEALTATTSGMALIAKTGIFALLFILGSINLFVLTPRLKSPDTNGRTWMGRTVRIEMTLGIFLLLSAGVLTGVAPAYNALQARQELGIVKTASLDGVDILLLVVPGKEGENEIGVEFTDTRTGTMGGAPEVLLYLTNTQMDMGTQQIRTTTADGLRYTARGSYFTMTGKWELEVIIRRSGYNDVRQIFEVDIQKKATP